MKEAAEELDLSRPATRWGLYPRRSLDRFGNEVSTGIQEQQMRQWVELHGGEVVDVYRDIESAFSGKRRPEYERMLVDLDNGRIDGILVWKMDRLMRQVTEWLRFSQYLARTKAALASVVESIDTSNRWGMLLVQILVTIAEQESENISIRMKMRHGYRAEQGHGHPSGRRPFGHSKDWTEIVEDEADLINEACRRILAGDGVSTVATDWKRRGVTTTWVETGEDGKVIPKGRRNHWTTQSLRDMLLSPRLVGSRPYRSGGDVRGGEGKVFESELIPAIIENAEDWVRMCEIIRGRGTKRGPAPKRLLSGVAKCGRCGHTLYSERRSNGTVLYKCLSRFDGCGKLGIPQLATDEYVAGQVFEFLADPVNLKRLSQRVAPDGAIAKLQQQLRQIANTLEQLDDQRFDPVDPMPHDRYLRRKRPLEEQLEQVQGELTRVSTQPVVAEVLAGGPIEEQWDKRDVAWRRTLLELVLDSVTIQPQQTVTMQDVATAAGVHVATASQALNPDTARPMPAKTRVRIQRVAEELGYWQKANATTDRVEVVFVDEVA